MARPLASISGAKFSQILDLNPGPVPPRTLQLEVFDVPGLFPDMIPIHNWYIPDNESLPIRVISIRIPARNKLELLFWNFGATSLTIPRLVLSLVCL